MTEHPGRVPALPDDLRALVDQLRSPDPAVRDEQAYSALAKRVASGREDAQLVAVGDAAAALLSDDAIQARTFGALLLASVVNRANTGVEGPRPVHVVSWLAAFAEWYGTETDLRGHDRGLGWLHAVAHGADVLGEFAASPLLGPAELLVLLDVARERVQAPTGHHLTQNEDDRLALAVMAVLSRDEVGIEELAGWVDRLARSWRGAPTGPVAPEVDNTLRFTRTLHLQLTLGVRHEPGADVRHPGTRDELVHLLGTALADVHWFYGRPEVRETV